MFLPRSRYIWLWFNEVGFEWKLISDHTRNGAGETGFAGSCAMLVEWLCPFALQCLLHIAVFTHRPSASRLLTNEDSVVVGLQGTKWHISLFSRTFAGASHSPASPAWTAFPIRGSWMPLFISHSEINNWTIKDFSDHRQSRFPLVHRRGRFSRFVCKVDWVFATTGIAMPITVNKQRALNTNIQNRPRWSSWALVEGSPGKVPYGK